MKIIANASLKAHNTFHIAAKSVYMLVIEQVEALYTADFQQYLSAGMYVLGQGSNVLLVEDLQVPVVHLATQGWQVIAEDDNSVTVAVEGGHDWHAFVCDMAQQGYWGLENLALIPGTVGASPVQNIGAYGVEMADCFVSLEAFDLHDKRTQVFTKADCEFGYRHSFFKQQARDKQDNAQYLIFRVVFKLSKNTNPQLAYANLSALLTPAASAPEIVDTISRIRQEKLPDLSTIGCAGSFFKNPVVSRECYHALKNAYPEMPAYVQSAGEDETMTYKIPAAWLIDTAGWKGYRQGDVGVYENQALVLVNHGDATGAEVKRLAQLIQNDIKARFAVEIQQEVIDF